MLPTILFRNRPFFNLPLFNLLGDGWSQPSFDQSAEHEAASWSPATDIVESDDAYEIAVELPGVNRDDVNVKLENGVLSISGERTKDAEQDVENNSSNYRRRERLYGNFSRNFRVPSTVVAEDVSASYTDGVLRVKLAKPEEATPKAITIN